MASRSLLLRLVASRLPRSWRTARRLSDPVASASRCPPRREGAPAAGCRGCWVRTLNRLVRPEGHDRRRNPLGTQRNPRRDAGGAKTAPGISRCNFGPPPAVRARSPPSTRPMRVTIPIGTPPFVDLPRKSLPPPYNAAGSVVAATPAGVRCVRSVRTDITPHLTFCVG
jgi:hypothetical protein